MEIFLGGCDEIFSQKNVKKNGLGKKKLHGKFRSSKVPRLKNYRVECFL